MHIRVPEKYRENFNSIRISYGRMFYEVRKIFEKNSPSLKDIKDLLSFHPNLRQKVDNCTDIFSILRLIQDECSLTNVNLLASVVEILEITEAEKHIINYKKKLNEFCRSIKVDLCLEKQFDLIHHLQCELAIFELDWKPEEHMLQHIMDILSKASELPGIKCIKLSGDSRSKAFSTSVVGSFPFSRDQALEKWMEEGSVDLTIICVIMLGITLFVHAEELQKVPVLLCSRMLALTACMVPDCTAFMT